MITLTGCLGQDQQTQEEVDEELIIEVQETDTDKEQEELKEYYEELDEQREEDRKNLEEATKGRELTREDCDIVKDPEYKEHCLGLADLNEQS
jgi:uncharacterized protein involved in exopolysaccharide biosynthesis